MDDLAYYFSNTEDEQGKKENVKKERYAGKGGRRPNALAAPRPASMHIPSKSVADASLSCLADIPEMELSQSIVSGKRHGQGMRVRNSGSVSFCSPAMPNQLPPEVEVGNIEYKRKLVDPTPNRFEHLVTQMKWRLNEGGGEAIYRLGVEDDGRIAGLTPVELASSLSTLERMATRLNATVHLLREKTVADALPISSNSSQSNLPGSSNDQPKKAMELLVRQCPLSNHGKPSVCIAVLGAVDVGKSTLIGVLTDGELDNARGRARLNLFRHLHEVQSGRTSCLSSEFLGFDAAGNVTNYKRVDGHVNRSSVDEFIRSSAQLVTLLDSAGHSKYQRTTVAGLARAFPVGVILVVSVTAGLTAIGVDHAQLAYTLGLPLAVVISKIDQLLTDADRSRQVAAVCRQISLRFSQLKQSLPGSRKKDTLSDPLFFPVSAVTGEGLEDLLCFLNEVGRNAHSRLHDHFTFPLTRTLSIDTNSSVVGAEPAVRKSEELFTQNVAQLITAAVAAYRSPFMCFWVSEVFTCVLGVPDPVLFGMVKSGQLVVGHVAWLGPDQTGEFHLIQIMSLHHNRQSHSVVYAGQTASVAVRFLINLPPIGNISTKVKSTESVTALPPVEKRRSSGPELDFLLSENDENALESVTDNTFTLPRDTLLPIVLRRGMVLLSNISWSASYVDVMYSGSGPLPLKLPHMVSPGQSVGVAWMVEVELVHRLSIFPGVTSSPMVIPPLPIVKQKVAFYAGCVAQPVVVVVEADLLHDSDLNPRVQLRFTRNPEYIEVGRQCILTWSSCAKAVGRVTKIIDLFPPDSLVSSIPFWINTRARVEVPLPVLMQKTGDQNYSLMALSSENNEMDGSFQYPAPEWSQPDVDECGTEELQSPLTVTTDNALTNTAAAMDRTANTTEPSTNPSTSGHDRLSNDTTGPPDATMSQLYSPVNSKSQLDSTANTSGPRHSFQWRRRRRRKRR